MSENLMTIPLCQLKRATLNVRKTGRKADLEQLAASIEAHGLLENLVVRLVRVGSEEAEPLYEVIAGGRRYDALKLLAKRHKITMDYPVPCKVLGEQDMSAYLEISLAENIVRAPLHPADQFDAFAKLQKEGLSATEIAARFGLPEKVVIQRLKLGAVSPRLMAAYRAEELTFDQLMAFAITDDHAAQEAFWFGGVHGDRSPRAIRRHLTGHLIEAHDRRALFVGHEAYEAAGGAIIRDLFQPESEGYFADGPLLDRLAKEKLEAAAEPFRAEGWGWVEILFETDYGALSAFGQLQPVAVALSEDDQARQTGLAERYDELVALLDEQENEEAVEELNRIEAELDSLEEKQLQWPEGGMAKAGVILSLSPEGEVKVNAGLVRPGDRSHVKREAGEEDGDGDTSTDSGDGKGEERRNGYSDTLLADLSAHRTVALREMLARRPKVALAALVHRLACRLFYEWPAGSCVNIRPDFPDLAPFSKTVGESPAAAALLVRHREWQERLPAEKEAFWPWLMQSDTEVLLELLAYCVSLTLDAVHRRNGSGDHGEMADQLAAAVSLDMRDWWQPTRPLFFDHLTKSQIVEAISESHSPSTAKYLADLKKADMAARAEELLKDKGWLPVSLRTKSAELATEGAIDTAAE